MLNRPRLVHQARGGRQRRRKKEGKRGAGKAKGERRNFWRVMAFKCETVLRRGVVLQVSPVICVKRRGTDLSTRGGTLFFYPPEPLRPSARFDVG